MCFHVSAVCRIVFLRPVFLKNSHALRSLVSFLSTESYRKFCEQKIFVKKNVIESEFLYNKVLRTKSPKNEGEKMFESFSFNFPDCCDNHVDDDVVRGDERERGERDDRG